MQGAHTSHCLATALPENLDKSGHILPSRSQCHTSKETGRGGMSADLVPLACRPGPGDFPTRAVVILVMCMTMNAYALSNLFPYVGMMVKDLLGLETTNEAGYYAGYVASAFTFGRFVSGYFWGRVTDVVGRKPVIIIGLLAIAMLSLAFGLSTSFTMAVSSRFVLGLVNGIVPALRTTLRELCGPEHMVRGMSYFSGCKSISLVLGTGVGGLLAMPAVHYPRWFSATGLFGRNPFLLPNVVGAVCAFLLLPLVIVYLPETKGFQDQREESKRTRRSREFAVDTKDRVADANGNGFYTGIPGQHTQAPGLWGPNGLLAMPNVKVLLLMACLSQFLLIGFDEVYPLWAVSTPDAGGLGWGTIQIGQVLLTTGAAMTISQFVLFPPLIKRMGIARWQQIGGLVSVPAYLFVPCVKLFSWNETSLFIASVVGTTVVSNCILANTLALGVASTSIVPPSVRGEMSGLYATAESLGRFIGPAGYATTFAWSISSPSYSWVDYKFVFYTSAALSGAMAVLAWLNFTLEALTQPLQPAQNRRPVGVHATAAAAAAAAAAATAAAAAIAAAATEQTALVSHTVPIPPVACGEIGTV